MAAIVVAGSLCSDRAWASFLASSDRGRPPLRPRARAACRPAWVRSRDQVPLELGQGAEDVKDELPAAGGRVDRLLEAAEADLPRLQGGDRLDQVLERAP